MPVKKKKKRRLSKFMRFVLCSIMVVISIGLIYSGFQELKTTAEINASIQENKQKSSDLDAKKEELEKTKENLTNPDYIEYLARGKYLVTRDGEQVFKFSKQNN